MSWSNPAMLLRLRVILLASFPRPRRAWALCATLLALSVTGCASSTSAGGAGGSDGGSPGTGGTGGAELDAGPLLPSCTPGIALDPVILDFNTPPTNPAQAQFGAFGRFGGGTYQYPAGSITSSFAGGNWHIIGTVMDYSGFGLYVYCKSNVAAFTGMQLDISGTFNTNDVGDGGIPAPQISVGVSQPADQLDTAHSTDVTWGTCMANCKSPSRALPITSTTTTVAMPWSSFAGGTPVDGLDPSAIDGIFFVFPWSSASTAPYTVDLTIDNIMFTGGTPVPPPDARAADAAD
jgi:hypothetical protein